MPRNGATTPKANRDYEGEARGNLPPRRMLLPWPHRHCEISPVPA